jgi:hypothetical protein
MSKPRKASARKIVRKSKLFPRPRAVPLAVKEPRVSTARQSRKTTTTSRATRMSLPPAVPGSAQIFQLMWQWSPWNIMLRQQAVLASMMSKMLRVKDRSIP